MKKIFITLVLLSNMKAFGITVNQLDAFNEQIEMGNESVCIQAVNAAVEGLQDSQGYIRGEAMALFANLFSHGYGFKEAISLINSGSICESFGHKRLTTGLIQLLHMYGQQELLG